MVDTVDSQVLFNEANRYAVRLTNVSDGTGETAVTKIDRSTLAGPGPDRGSGRAAPTKLVVEEIHWSVQGFTAVKLEWTDGTNQVIDHLTGDNYKYYKHLGGLVPDDHADQVATPANGDIELTTLGAVANATYDIVIVVRLKA